MNPTPTPTPVATSLSALAKSFDPSAIEAPAQALFEQQGVAQGGYRGTGQAQEGQAAFAMLLPPPNVTGTLHMGHGFNQTIMDALVRYHRMQGHNTVWIPGTDHAGIATQIVVERQLQAQGQRKEDLGRTGFIERVWQWKEQSGDTIMAQMSRLGASVDTQRLYFTMDDKLCQAVTEAFVRLYEQGLIYRGKRLVNWDPVLCTAVSDLEVESQEEAGFLWHIAYPVVGKEARVVVATTRPETLLGDVAVMVHPDDVRYRHLIGQQVHLPLCDRTIPVIADTYVDQAFGTGVVKVTPAHDPNDFLVGQRHGLPCLSILTKTACINDQAPQAYQGLDRFEARKRIVADLEAAGFLVEIKKHQLMVPRCTRTGQIVEPLLTDQWFVATTKTSPQDLDPTGKSLAQKTIEAVHSGKVRLVPENWINTFDQWMNHIQDWCISRQLWWGHAIPAWYDEEGQIYVARSEQAAQAQAPGKRLTRDPDVLDTWFSSALLPFSTLGWPQETPDLARYLPSQILVTGYDILFFWVARMIMMSTHFTGRVPFEQVYIHGLVRDAHGQKMSKSEGNVLDPVDLIDGIELPALLDKRTQGLRRPEMAPQVRENTAKEFPEGIPAFGADALRLTFASLASLGRSINFDSKRCEGYRNFCNKLWNATRFVLMHTENQDCGVSQTKQPNRDVWADLSPSLSVYDRWIMSELQKTTEAVTQSFAALRVDHVTQSLYHFVWDHFCDWYLEIAKVQLQQGAAAQQRATRYTLIHVLEAILRLLHPIAPFITQTLWQAVWPLQGLSAGHPVTVALAAYPVAEPARLDESSETAFLRLQAWVQAARYLRSQMQVSPATKLPLYIAPITSITSISPTDEVSTAWVHEQAPVLQSLCRLSEVTVLSDAARWETLKASCPVTAVDGVSLCLHLAVDPVQEQARLQKEQARLQVEIEKAKTKLNNPAFANKAPAAVIDQEKTRLAQFESQLAQIAQRLASF